MNGIKFAYDENYVDIDAVMDEYPGAAKIVRVDGGWMVFGTLFDYNTWINQW